jgi:hypothetical protein
MEMLDRVLDKVCDENYLASHGSDAHRIAILLLREFDHGVTEEVNLLFNFTGDMSFSFEVRDAVTGGTSTAGFEVEYDVAKAPCEVASFAWLDRA